MGTQESFKIMTYIDNNPMAVLSTVNDDGTPYGAVVYVCTVGELVCFVTKNQTQKYQNIIKRPAISLTIGNEKESSTLQVTGQAFALEDAQLLDMAMKRMQAIHAMRAEWLPPLAKLRAGSYAMMGVKIIHARLGEFRGLDIGSHEIFTEI